MARPSRKTVKKAARALASKRTSKTTKSLAGYAMRDARRGSKKRK